MSERRICGAKTRQNDGKPCRRAPMPNGRCYLHGGASTGPKTMTAGGRYSKYLPQRLAARFAEALRDPELTTLTAELALLDTRIGELLGRLDTSESCFAWRGALQVCAKLEAEEPGTTSFRAILGSLTELLEKGAGDSQQWAEVAELVERRRRLAETEARRLAQLDQFLTAKQANLLVSALLQLVTENVADPDARRRIGLGLVRLVGGEDRPGADLH